MSSSVQMKTAAQKGREFLKVTRSQNTCKHGSMCEVHRCPRRAGRGPSHSTPCLCGKQQALSTAKGVVQEHSRLGGLRHSPIKGVQLSTYYVSGKQAGEEPGMEGDTVERSPFFLRRLPCPGICSSLLPSALGDLTGDAGALLVRAAGFQQESPYPLGPAPQRTGSKAPSTVFPLSPNLPKSFDL